MPNSSSPSRSATLIGLVIALLGIPFVVTMFGLAVPVTTSASQLVIRELAILALVALLAWLIIAKERLPLTSIGLFHETTRRTLVWGIGGFLALGVGTVLALGLLQLLGLTYGSGGSKFVAPVWATLLIVVRAGIAEEVFYRGFAIERLELLTGNRWIAATIPLIFFAGLHYRQGLAGILIALILGGILTGLYLWKRNLTANIIAHFLIDFVPNVALPLLLIR